MIDKKIFYCWFGNGNMSELNKQCIASWKKHCPDYEIVEINESNFDYTITPYCQAAYEHGNWSYVSNTARLEILKHNSGFYLDTDVQLIKSLDSLREYDKGFLTEFLSSQPDSGVLGCGAEFSDFYDTVYTHLVPGTVLHKEFIKELYKRYDLHGQDIETFDDGFTILGEQYFPSVRTSLLTTKTIGIHYFENTWANQWREITDGFRPFPRFIAYLGNKQLHADEDPEVIVRIKNFNAKIGSESVISKLVYFLNPKVVNIFTPDFEAWRIGVKLDEVVHRDTTITPTGTLVTRSLD